MKTNVKFALNRITCPNLGMENYFKLAKELDLNAVELRNDINDGKILDNYSPQEIAQLSHKYGINILSINAVQHFNLQSCIENVIKEVLELKELSEKINCKFIVLCPHNDVNDKRSPEECYAETVNALHKIGKIIKGTGIIGLVEPLGFEECSLRSKTAAVKAIKNSGYQACFKMTHDTFHHFLSGDTEIYPEYTGFVHISGVTSQLPKTMIKDKHRALINSNDIMNNKEQLKAFIYKNYKGYFSFEPFSPEIQELSIKELKNGLSASIKHLISAK